MTTVPGDHEIVHGRCDPAFASVLDAFRRNFTERREVGAAVAVYLDGEIMVDLHGGHLDRKRTRPWREDTLCTMYSIAKSMCALCVHMLADRGSIDLEAPVATYWPEFAQNGKAAIRVRHILSHHCGVCFNDDAAPGTIYDYDAMVRSIERIEPAWPAGSKGAYNSINFGFLNGELVWRVSGMPVNQFLRENVCGPLGADYQIGLSEDDLARVTDIYPNPENMQFRMAQTPDAPLARVWRAGPRRLTEETINSREWRLALLPFAGGYGTARAMACIYAALANHGTLNGVRLLGPQAVERARTQQWQEQSDGVLQRPYRMAMGFFKNNPGWIGMGPNMNAFGHHGSGGALAFADPEHNLAFAAQSNFQCEGTGVGRRTEALVEATFASLA